MIGTFKYCFSVISQNMSFKKNPRSVYDTYSRYALSAVNCFYNLPRIPETADNNEASTRSISLFVRQAVKPIIREYCGATVYNSISLVTSKRWLRIGNDIDRSDEICYKL